ncbi:MAG: GYF domain-containing protein [Hyphomicrobiaceae bacterium]
MAGTTSNAEWYIARDGAQHGPLSDTEMRKFVELGYLRLDDLVWSAGFDDWKPAPQAFPELSARQAAAEKAAQTQPSAARAQPEPTPANRAGGPVAVQQLERPKAAGAQPLPSQPRQGAPRQAQQPGQQRGAAPGQLAPAAQHAGGHPPGGIAPSPADWGNRRDGDGAFGAGDHAFDDDEDYGEAGGKRGLGKFAAVVAMVLIVGGSGWVAWQYRSALTGVTGIGSAVVAKVMPTPRAELFQASPYVAKGTSTEDIDDSLQHSAVWRVLKRDFGEWYGERLLDIERKRSSKEDEKVISKFMADVIVVLRRKHGQSALQSSPEHLRQMASAFLGNLKQLASRDAPTCFGYISFGEANAFMLELTKTPAFAEPMQKQLTAVFEAIADGRKQPKIYQTARRTDYDTLTAELIKRGWTQEDLAVFSNPGRLSKSAPEKVCRMVQDWFAAQLAIKDTELQGRLLAESLKPLVFG